MQSAGFPAIGSSLRQLNDSFLSVGLHSVLATRQKRVFAISEIGIENCKALSLVEHQLRGYSLQIKWDQFLATSITFSSQDMP